jgi:hypothetical protein
MRTHTIALLAALGPLVTACQKKDDPSPLPAPATKLAESKAAPEVQATRYAIENAGRTSIDMPAPKEHIKARTTAAAGWIDVDLTSFANTRGEVRVDLTTLTTFTFGDADKDSAQTEHARTWLEAVVEGKTNEQHRWAVYAIRSVDGLSAADASKIAPTQEGGEDIRVLTLTAHGELLLHGRTSAKNVKLQAKLHYPSGAAPMSPPTRIDIRSVEPMSIVLAEHDVKPRDTFGKIAQRSFYLLGTKVADTAAVSIELSAAKGGAP